MLRRQELLASAGYMEGTLVTKHHTAKAAKPASVYVLLMINNSSNP